MSDKEFVTGMFAKRHDNAPDFVLCNLSIKAKDFAHWMKANMNEEGWVNIDVKRSRGGKVYADKNDFKPKQGGPNLPADDFSDDIPFRRLEDW